LGQLLREFTHGHSLHVSAVARAHLVNLVEHSSLLPGLADRAFVDWHTKQEHHDDPSRSFRCSQDGHDSLLVVADGRG